MGQTLHFNLGDANYKMNGPDDMSGTKSSIGHLLGGSGAIESALTLQALKSGICPATKNLDTPDDIVPKYINLVPNEPQSMHKDAEYAMSNSFGFGGTNASILFKKRHT